MNHLSTHFAVLILLFAGLHAQRADESQDSITISVLHSNNHSLDVRAAFYPYPFRPSDSVAEQIRSSLHESCALEHLAEEQAFEKALLWVHLQWQHDPLNSIADRSSSLEILQRAHKGERFTCVEYSKVLSDILIANGYYARMVGLSRRNISNPLSGARHVGVEVWSCAQNKWIYLDPQFGIRPVEHDTALNARELQRAITANDPELKLICVDTSLHAEQALHDSTIQRYRHFVHAHNAFVDVPYAVEGSVGLAMLVPDDRNEPMLFQGKPLSSIEYTKDASQLYAPLGQIHLELDYDYRANTPEAPLKHPAYKITCTTSYPWARHFEYQTDSSAWQKMSANSMHWTLHPGINEIHVRALCSSGCYTQDASMKVYYGLRADARSIRHPVTREAGVLPRIGK